MLEGYIEVDPTGINKLDELDGEIVRNYWTGLEELQQCLG